MKLLPMMLAATITLTCPGWHEIADFGSGIGRLEALKAQMAEKGISLNVVERIMVGQLQEGVDMTKCTGTGLPPVSPPKSVEETPR